jgi:hypothetical protein
MYNLKHQISSAVSSKLNNMVKNNIFCLNGKSQTNVNYNNTMNCLDFSVQNIRIHFTFTVLQQSYLYQLSYCAVCMSVSDCTTVVPTLQTVQQSSQPYRLYNSRPNRTDCTTVVPTLQTVQQSSQPYRLYNSRPNPTNCTFHINCNGNLKYI